MECAMSTEQLCDNDCSIRLFDFWHVYDAVHVQVQLCSRICNRDCPLFFHELLLLRQ